MSSDTVTRNARLSSSLGPAQKTLARVLRTAFGDLSRGWPVLEEALAAARLRDVPADLEALLGFLRAHLGPRMAPHVGSALVAAFIEDLEAAMELGGSGDDSSVSRLAVATRPPPRPSEEDLPATEPSFAQPAVGRAFEELRADLSFDDAPPDSTVRRSHAPPRSPAPARPTVFVVDPDRFGRASLSRALVSGRCDVNVLDDAASAVAALSAQEPPNVIVTEVTGIEIEALLAAVLTCAPTPALIAWTRLPRANVEHLMWGAGVVSFRVVPKAARTADVVTIVRSLAARSG